MVAGRRQWHRRRTVDRPTVDSRFVPISTDTTLDQQTVDDIIAEWPDEPTQIAEEMMDTYGLPDEGAPSELPWWDTGPWKRTELYRDGVPHEFPKEHTDYLKQVIDYHGPPEKFDELAQFDGSVYPDRTNGELAAKCDREAANFLAINLAHDLIKEETTVDDARQEYATTMVKMMAGADPDYTSGLQFGVPTRDVRDPDESVITDAMKEEIEEKLGMEGGGGGSEVEAEEEEE